ncbi:phosphopantetheine-binding protein [Nocardia sp. NPDC049149]|uniref:phosphopantetheine-binding protein n=1 Tax=Nocardia sp. NPDC049149 TaxID=3364315 RepID=UPI0037157CB1
MAEEATTTVDRETVIADIAAMLGIAPAELTEETNLLDAGMDSVRLMSLVERWRAGGAAHADFVTLASDPVLGVWLDVLAP